MLAWLDGRHPEPVAPREASTVLLLVDSVDLAVLRAIRYARTLRAPELRAVHFVIDSAHAAALRAAWDAQPGLEIPLELIDCPDRRLPRAATELALRSTTRPGDEVTVLLPRRSQLSAACCTTALLTTSPEPSGSCQARPPRSCPSTSSGRCPSRPCSRARRPWPTDS